MRIHTSGHAPSQTGKKTTTARIKDRKEKVVSELGDFVYFAMNFKQLSHTLKWYKLNGKTDLIKR